MADSLASLVDILQERDITYDRDALKAAIEDPESESAVRAWIDEYLTPETLLTKEEAALWVLEAEEV